MIRRTASPCNLRNHSIHRMLPILLDSFFWELDCVSGVVGLAMQFGSL